MKTGETKSFDTEQTGVAAIRRALRTAPTTPGVYRMLDAAGDVLYVGKAKHIRRRVTSYVRSAGLSTRIRRMVALTRQMEFVSTHTEAEALLLEASLIKRWRPPFNVILRDDKSFPYIAIFGDHAFPRLGKHRGARRAKGEYFGPFASAGHVNRTLNTLQKIFLLRSCSDSVFANRSRPCLLYQIKRCSAPCVGRIDAAAYDRLVADTRDFLLGRSTDIQDRLAASMSEAAEALDFETAAILRDRLKALAHIQSQQSVASARISDADIVAIATAGGRSCIQVFFFRGGLNRGNRPYFPRHEPDAGEEEILAQFLAQFYDDKPAPGLILLDRRLKDGALLAEALSLGAGRRVVLSTPQRGEKRRLVAAAADNARRALDRRLAETANESRLMALVAEALGLARSPERIEVYDNSHIQGAHALGAMIVAGREGFEKARYRRFDMRRTELVPGDDFAMMREMLERRFARLLREDPERDRGLWPDLVLIDGGKGQLGIAEEVMTRLGVDDVALVAVSKGPERNAGREQFHMPGRDAPLMLKPGDPALHYLQRLRDEAHRFAISGHRAKRTRAIAANPLDDVPGIGPKRKRALLHHFGSAKGVADAALHDLMLVEGISEGMARTIYDHFHEG